MVPGRLHRLLELSLVASTCLSGCDQSADDDSTQERLSYSQPPPSSAPASGSTVQVVINRSPIVTAMSSSAGVVTAETPLELQAIASDPDGDVLTLRWQATCPGTFAHDDTIPATFVPGDLPADGDGCTFEVTIEDGRGGEATGMLTLSTVPPKIHVLGGSDEADATGRRSE